MKEEKDKKKCKYCGEVILPKQGQKEVSKNRKYCSPSCGLKFNYYRDHEKTKQYHNNYMKKYYQDNKEKIDSWTQRYRETPAGKSYMKKYRDRPEVKERYKKWKEENREELNKKRREYMKTYMRKRSKNNKN